MVTEFDSIADIYDSTREPATDAEISAMSDALKGCETVLDVGVGTGRFAKPLSELGFHITGVDISRNMMLKAREKGVDNLVLADARARKFERRGPFMIHDVPEEVHKRIVEEIVVMKGKERFERRIIEELAVWESAQLESLGKPDLS